MPPAWNRNRLTERLGIDYPIIQGPLGGLSSQKLTAAVSNFGGLGSVGALSLPPAAITDVIAEIRSLTSRPFAVNLWVSMEDEGARTSDEAAFNRSLEPLAGHLAALGALRPSYQPASPLRFEDQVRVLLDANVPVFSFIFGIPPREILEECRAKAIATIGTATTPDEALALEQAGVDAIVASGFEAGGHRGSFLRPAEDSLIGTMSLVPQVVDRVEVPVIAAGGIGDARGVTAALALGAEGVQLGTAFLISEDSGASRLHREALLGPNAGHTGLTRGFTGRLARGIRNRLMEELNRPDTELLPYPLQRGLIRNLATAAEAAGRADLMPLWAGQSATLSTGTDAPTLLSALVDDLYDIAGPVVQWSVSRRHQTAHHGDTENTEVARTGQSGIG
jgi:nitronate monooxygenase